MSERDERLNFGEEPADGRLESVQERSIDDFELELEEGEHACVREAFERLTPNEAAKTRMWEAIAAAAENVEPTVEAADPALTDGSRDEDGEETLDGLKRDDMTVYRPRKRRVAGIAVAACLVLIAGLGLFAASGAFSAKGSYELAAPMAEEEVFASDEEALEEAGFASEEAKRSFEDADAVNDAAETPESGMMDLLAEDAAMEDVEEFAAAESAAGAAASPEAAVAADDYGPAYEAALARGSLVLEFEGEQYTLDSNRRSMENEVGDFLGMGTLVCMDDSSLGSLEVEVYLHGSSSVTEPLLVRLPGGAYAIATKGLK